MASQQSTRLKIPYPASNDQANISADMGGIATSAIDNAVIYHQNASGATPPSGNIGDIWWCTDATNTGGYYGLNYYDGTNWQNIGPDVISSTTAPSTPFPGMIWINPSTGSIQVYVAGTPSGSWQTLVAYKIPAATTDGQFLQYNGSTGALQWTAVSAIPSGATSGQLLYYNGSTNAWRNPPSSVVGNVATTGIAISTTTGTLIPSSAMNGTLTGFSQYLFTVSFDTTALYSGTAGTNPGAAGSVAVQFVATPNTGSTLTARAFGGTFASGVGAGGSAHAAIVNATATSIYSFSVNAVTSSGGMTVKNGQLTVIGIK